MRICTRSFLTTPLAGLATGLLVGIGSPAAAPAEPGDLQGNLPAPNPTSSGYFGISLWSDGSPEIVVSGSGFAYLIDAATRNVVRRFDPPIAYDSSIGPPRIGGAAASADYVSMLDPRPSRFMNPVIPTVLQFSRQTGAFVRRIDSPNPNESSAFGSACAFADGLLFAADYRHSGTGAVHVYDAATGALVRTLANPDPHDNDYFGFSMHSRGSTLVVGAPSYVSPGATDGGVAYVYQAFSSTPTHTLFNPSPDVKDQFGYSVALLDSLVAVSAPRTLTIGGSDPGTVPGEVYLFDRNTGALVRTITDPHTSTGGFGAKVASAGSHLLIANPYALDRVGRAYVYDPQTGNLVLSVPNPASGTSELFGAGMGYSGDALAIAAPRDSTVGGSDGRVYFHEAPSGPVSGVEDWNSY